MAGSRLRAHRLSLAHGPVALGWLTIVLAVCSGHAQAGDAFTAPNPGPGIVQIQGKWRFHTGDDLTWSKPALDDSTWEQMNAAHWGQQGHYGYTGFAWYRKRIHLTGTPGKVSVLIPPVQDAYEVFWNGEKIGAFGKLPPHAVWYQVGRGLVYPVGTAPLDGVLALRVWQSPNSLVDDGNSGGLLSAPLLGSPAVLTQRTLFALVRQEDQMLPRFIISGALLITGLIALLLFFRERRDFLYLWFACFLLAAGLSCWELLNGEYFGLTSFPQILCQVLVQALQDISLWLLLLTLFGLHTRKAWRRWTLTLIALYLAAMVVVLVICALWEYVGPAMIGVDAIIQGLLNFLPLYILFVVGFAFWQRPSRSLLPIAITATVYGTYNAGLVIAPWILRFAHFDLMHYLYPAIPLGPYFFGMPLILNLLFFLVLLYTVARYQAQERRRQIHMESEIRSAHEIQHVLIPEAVPTIPGFSIAGVYKPASEVGGDFYQVIPLVDSTGEPGALIVLGDVSGKGLKAAMTVSLIVGTLRTLADFTDDPAQIMARLNQRLLGRTQGGFTTCIALRMDASGKTVISNAGHLSPFCAGREVVLPGSLPLGLSGDAEYESVTLHLEPDETLTLYTDGILEARTPKGELYGFDRLVSLMTGQPSAQQVVDTACAFGQDDDITVLSVTRVAEHEPDGAAVSMVTQIAG